MALSLHETCLEYVARRLSEGWSIVWQRGVHLILSSPDGNILRPVDIRNDVETLRPNAAGDETLIPDQYPDSTFHWDKVDEVVADNDATYVQFTPTAEAERQYATDLYAIPNPSLAGVINSVTVYICHKAQYANMWSFPFVALKTHGVVYAYEKSAVTTYTLFNEELAVNPNTSSAWTWDEINDLQIGVKLAGGSSQWSRCTQVYVEVDYTPTPPYKPGTRTAHMAAKMIARKLI